MFHFPIRWCVMLIALLPLSHSTIAVDAPSLVSEGDVRVERAGGSFTVDLLAHAPVSPAQAWAVLTDFEHMADFVPNLRTSVVTERTDTLVRVRQSGTARYGIFWTDFESVREVRLFPPHEIRAHGVGGNVRRMDSVMRLEPETGGTLLRYHAEVQPDFWLPPLLGPSFVRHETAEQFAAIIQEMVRRR
ncbi:hypothetical protein GPA25_10700 [Aromatoleum diolicum]|uniref:Coenzyme Q-binding protein COQ10 START domain-containing protein n=2 Tax=Aromatoleum diolicum TaxID=75796 RepID=A0ABX1QDG2_9RHOO|nr:hypothetical protein [Aromatoleum diolicum]